jgi:hypothetical protein
MKKSIKIEEVLKIYTKEWDNGNILSPRELEQALQSRGGQAIKPPTKFNSSSPQDTEIELSLCKFCNCMTKTMQVAGLSASENKHYRYECGKCGAKKELEIVARIGGIKNDERTND